MSGAHPGFPSTSRLRRAYKLFNRWWLALAVTVFSVEFVAAAEELDPQIPAEIVELHAMVVEASSGIPWSYTSVPGFEVLSRCPDNFTAKYIQSLQQSQQARLSVLPDRFWASLPTPIKIVLYDVERKASNRGSMLSNPLDIHWGAGEGESASGLRVDLAYPETLGDGDSFVIAANYRMIRESESSNLTVDPDSELKLRLRAPQFPPWFLNAIEGPRGVFSGHYIDHETLVLPSMIWISPSETAALRESFRRAEKRKRPLPLPEILPLQDFFGGHPDSNHLELWHFQAGLFARWGLFADNGAHREAFLQFCQRYSEERASPTLFAKCFDLTYAQAEQSLRAAIPNALAEPLRIDLPPLPEKKLITREATSTEVARIVGEWSSLRSRRMDPRFLEFQSECVKRASTLFEKERARETGDAQFLATYGIYAMQLGDLVNAKPALEGAVAQSVVRPRAYVELARLRLKASLASYPQGFGDLDEATFNEIEGLLDIARKQMPGLVAIYHLQAQVLEHGPQRPSLEKVQALIAEAKNFPNNDQLTQRVVTTAHRCGYDKEADALMAWIVQHR